jgi:predicted MFS family arabinose efflux permease
VECKGEKLDRWGTLIYIIMLALVLIGFSTIMGALGIIMVILGSISFIIFIMWELKVKNPVLGELFFKNKKFAFSNLATFISYISTFAVSFLLSLYLQFIKGFDPRAAGLILVVQTIFMVVLSPAAGRLSDKFDPGKLASLGMGIITIGLLILALITAETSLYIIILALAIMGMELEYFQPPMQTPSWGLLKRNIWAYLLQY